MASFGRYLQEASNGTTATLVVYEEVTENNGNETLKDTTEDSKIIRETLRVYGSLYLFCFLLFCFLRKRYPRFFSVRSWAPEHYCAVAEEQVRSTGWFSWILSVQRVSDEELLDQCGMDAVCFIRTLHFGRRLCFMGCLNAAWLIPLYLLAPDSEETNYLTDPLSLITISNLPPTSERFLGTVVAAYITFGYTMYLIVGEFLWYTDQRHEFLAKPTPSNYAVYVSGIPREYRSGVQLKAYFDRCSARVLDAAVTQDLPSLEAKIAKRQQVIHRLEHAHALRRRLKRRESEAHHQKSLRRGRKLERQSENWERELDKLNQEIGASIRFVISKNDPKRSKLLQTRHAARSRALTEEVDNAEVISLCTDENRAVAKHTEIDESFMTAREDDTSFVVDEDSTSYDGRNTRSGESLSSSEKSFSTPRKLKASMATVAKQGNSFVKTKVKPKMDGVLHTAGQKGVKGMKMAQHVGSNIVTSAGAVLPVLLNKEEGDSREGGFVVFTNLYDTQAARQIVHHQKAHTMEVHEAPDPKDIFWRNVGMPARARRMGKLAAITAAALLCFFYTIPISFISSLTEVSTLKEALPKLGAWIDDHPRTEPFFALLAPLLLVIIDELLLPRLLRYFALWEGHVSASMLEASLFVKLGCFKIIQTFFVSAISGGITAELNNIIEYPGSLIDLLANSLPGQSSYFIQIILVSTCLVQSICCLRVAALGFAALRRCVGPNITDKEKHRRLGILRPVGDPPEFRQAKPCALLVLFFMVFFVYSTIAPITCFFLLFCFLVVEIGYRYQLIHNYPRAFETGGRLWMHFIQFTMACMVIAQLTLIGLLALKQSVAAGPALGPLIGFTALFICLVHSELVHVSKYLPSYRCVEIDEERLESGTSNTAFCRDAYLQPSLRKPFLRPEYEIDESFAGGEKASDVEE